MSALRTPRERWIQAGPYAITISVVLMAALGCSTVEPSRDEKSMTKVKPADASTGNRGSVRCPYCKEEFLLDV